MSEFASVGHSTRSVDELVAILAEANVAVLADIRHYPRSRRNPQSNRESLARELCARGIEYVWLGELLGGLRAGGFTRWMATPEFDRGIRELESLAARGRCAFMCAEAVPDQCHRRFVARELVARGHRVLHLLALGRAAWEQEPLGPSGTT